MSIKYNLSDKSKAGRRLLAQVATARQWAQMKANRRFKSKNREGKGYKPGVTVLGLSAVSEAIKKDFGRIVGRRKRREGDLLRVVDGQRLEFYNGPFTANYNGEGPVRVAHVVNPYRQSVRWRNG